ncbi:hypothetical protein KBB92_00940 [Candidatus Shapirobacteria bacterium]|nr:hypothetical protein [Candidatus Shapirobacteria bacterium]
MRRIFSLLVIPQEGNNFRALLLKPSFLCLIIAFYLFNQSIIKSLTIIRPGVLGYSSEITIQKVLDQTNKEREKLGLPLLKYNSLLSQSAKLKAEDMFNNDYWAHISPDGVSPWEFFKKSGYQYTVAGENLARDFYDTETLLKAWMNSPTHRDNIVKNDYQEIGIAVVDGVLNGVKTTLVVEHFASPTPAQSTFNQKNSAEVYSIPNYSSTLGDSGVSPSVPKINPLTLSKIVGLTLFSIIIAVLAIDSYLTLKSDTRRFTGSSAGHIAFLMVVMLLLISSKSGTIF